MTTEPCVVNLTEIVIFQGSTINPTTPTNGYFDSTIIPNANSTAGWYMHTSPPIRSPNTQTTWPISSGHSSQYHNFSFQLPWQTYNKRTNLQGTLLSLSTIWTIMVMNTHTNRKGNHFLDTLLSRFLLACKLIRKIHQHNQTGFQTEYTSLCQYIHILLYSLKFLHVVCSP